MSTERGFTVVESLVALSILGIALAGILPSFINLMHVNSKSEGSSDSVAAAQLVLERARRTDPASMPTSGSATEAVDVGGNAYDVVTTYCVLNEFCTTASRHVTIEVYHGSSQVYDVEVVYTRLQ